MGRTITDGYTRTAIVLHWMTAALIVSGFGLGLYLEDLPLSPVKLKLFSYHKWIGVTVFLLAICRLLWRVFHPAPPLPERMPAWERLAARSTHFMLYGLMLIIPVTGWLTSSARGFQTVYLGLVPLPDLVEKNKETAKLLGTVHSMLNDGLLLLVLGHAAAALKHHFIDRDDILMRMLRSKKSSLIILLALLMAMPVCADAAPLLREASRLDFVSKQMGAPVRGSFNRFDGDIVVNEKNPGNSRAAVTIHMDGIDAGSDDANVEVRRKPWFDVKNHPRAEFVSTSVTPMGNNQFRVAGKVTIKGVTRDVAVPISARKEKDGWWFEGRFTLNRLDFNIGEGAWADVSTVANAVEVSFRFLVPASGKAGK